MPSQPGVGLAIAIGLLVIVAVTASFVGRLRIHRSLLTASLRAAGQLLVVSLVIAVVLRSLALSALFVVLMFAIAVFTTSRRVGVVSSAWPWVALAMASGAVPVLLVIFASGAVPFNGPSLVPFAGIVIGGAMTAHSLTGRRVFAALREHSGTYEAALSIGLVRRDAISEVTQGLLPEALVPALDQTRTVGLVTLPGAYVGVLLGGGSAYQAGAAQLLVLVGLLAAETVTVVVAGRLIAAARLLPPDLAEALHR